MSPPSFPYNVISPREEGRRKTGERRREREREEGRREREEGRRKREAGRFFQSPPLPISPSPPL
ncbi:hypothetical protein, partial [Tychonema sp. LEGE 06208]|uniref:hypothetical protein n=1 Tax=Tychonema sp. LEGE 06208 TaxID=1828663 RepID=UPI001882366B